MKTTKRLPAVAMSAASDDGHLGIGHLAVKLGATAAAKAEPRAAAP